MTLLQRLKTAERTRTPANCMGTALFIAGLRDEDGRVYSNEFYKEFYKLLTPTTHPCTGDIAAWETEIEIKDQKRKECVHLAVVLRSNPLVLITRNGDYFDLLGEDEKFPTRGDNAGAKLLTLEDLNEKYKGESVEVNYYANYTPGSP